ncbi:hypothetical protein DERP_000788 [Dermatophagoides pteronyssinus]|uniref:GDP-mannose 4,6-dehydratase n=1 Tax=Dermatophagoides pteronyssinus TaxID=6956 RepID=A0ABQ8J146_DERPT|nr:hypothetical protein DERP_000788 [Dermatophagoides pteronyssinus]
MNGHTRKIALITGISGQDGSYLAEFLIDKGYEVHGIIRRSSSFNTGRIQHLYKDRSTHQEGCKLISIPLHDYISNGQKNQEWQFYSNLAMKLHYGDMTDSTCLVRLIHEIKPDEIYNLAAQSHVKVSFDLSEYTANVDALGTLRLLDAIRTANITNENGKLKMKFYQASTSELYGKVQEVPQRETTPFYPRSPYGVAKSFAYWIVVNYREAYEMFAVNGILFNHESPRRGETFVTRKITRGVAKILLNRQEFIELGNLDSKRDWGHARDYVEAMWLMLQQENPEDFVIATGEAHSVREFVESAFKHIDREIIWEGNGLNEVGKEKQTGIIRVKVNARYFRPAEVDFLLGDASKAKRKLDWKPKTSFQELVKEMVDADIELMKQNPYA